MNLLGRTWLLAEELIARDADHGEALRGKTILEALKC
jgi:hypothetical protein